MTASNTIYFDYAATTPVDERVAELMIKYLTFEGGFGNPASRSHSYGWVAEEAVETARAQVAAAVNADVREIVWTSGATEANNLAIKGAAHFYKSRGKHLITSKIEHKAVLDCFRQLEREGFEVTYLEPDTTGAITVESVEAALREDTIFASFMAVNNELGTINDLKAIGTLLRSKNVIFHVDGAQSVGKIKVDLAELPVDLMSYSAHKAYGPKGMGALFVRRKPRIRLESQMHGGGHERGMRSGTLPTHQIAGMGAAFEIAVQQFDEEQAKCAALKHGLWDGIKDIEAIYINGTLDNSVPQILNVSFAFVEGESLMMSLKNLAVSSGSACTSASLEPSYVLRALGLSDELAHSSIRFSFGRYSTEADVDTAIQQIHHAVEKLRALSPLWDMYKDGVDLDKVEWQHH
ncbi:MAG TPA: IscS subfamily cysteine desulfurase [Gammaproteobacteria bacterium]|nr:IscS subfamily cysteine desulfurase [Gammaproteobacteria bacterium]